MQFSSSFQFHKLISYRLCTLSCFLPGYQLCVEIALKRALILQQIITNQQVCAKCERENILISTYAISVIINVVLKTEHDNLFFSIFSPLNFPDDHYVITRKVTIISCYYLV
jgi:hypothetical protein